MTKITRFPIPTKPASTALANRPVTYADRAAFEAATVPAQVQRWSVIHAGRALDYVRDPAGTAIESANGVKGSPADVATPQHWGFVSGNATSALDAMFEWARATPDRRNILFPTGLYRYDGDGMRLTGADWAIVFGAGAMVWRNSDGKLLVLDSREAVCRRVVIRNPRGYSTLPAGSRDNTHLIEFLSEPVAGEGAQDVVIENPSGSGLKSVIHFTKTSPKPWSGIDQLQKWHKINVVNLMSDQNNGSQGFPEHAVLWDSGTGDHLSFIGGMYRTSGVSVKGGDGDQAIHDTTFVGVHFLGQSGGLHLIGPADPARYRRNVAVSGCQFDGAQSALGGFTYRFERLSHFSVLGCNSQSGVAHQLIDCSGPYIIEDNLRNIKMTGRLEAGELREGGVHVGPLTDVEEWTPTVSFVSAGDMSVNMQSVTMGRYKRFGDMAYVNFRVRFTPTFATSTGTLLIGGFPLDMDATEGRRARLAAVVQRFDLTGVSGLTVRPNAANNFRVEGSVSGGSGFETLTALRCQSGQSHAIEASGWVLLA